MQGAMGTRVGESLDRRRAGGACKGSSQHIRRVKQKDDKREGTYKWDRENGANEEGLCSRSNKVLKQMKKEAVSSYCGQNARGRAPEGGGARKKKGAVKQCVKRCKRQYTVWEQRD